MVFLYNIFILLLILGMKIGSIFNAKIRKGWLGRKESLQKIRENFSTKDKVIWMHAASLGEYEQGLPVLEGLKKQYPNHKILVTFFSPSGYENVKKKQTIADVICYLPFDTKSRIQSFISQFQADIFFTVKYDYWYHLLEQLKKRGTQIYVISALFYPKQVFFKPYGKWMLARLKRNINWIFHQTETSNQLAKGLGLVQSSVSGDTRFDRVRQMWIRDNQVPYIKEFIGDKKCVVFGSSWQSEEKIAEKLIKKHSDVKLIIAPHHLKRVEILKSIFPDAVLYSQMEERDSYPQVMIIDCIGLLSKIYSYGDIAVVGGGFHSAGLHNILEAATFGMPVVFGAYYKKNPEADGLISFGGAQSFYDENTATEFIVELIDKDKQREEMAGKSELFIKNQPHSTQIVLQKIMDINKNHSNNY